MPAVATLHAHAGGLRLLWMTNSRWLDIICLLFQVVCQATHGGMIRGAHWNACLRGYDNHWGKTIAAQQHAHLIEAGSLKLPSVCSATTDAGHSGVGSSTFMRTPIFACAPVCTCPLLLVRLYFHIFTTPSTELLVA